MSWKGMKNWHKSKRYRSQSTHGPSTSSLKVDTTTLVIRRDRQTGRPHPHKMVPIGTQHGDRDRKMDKDKKRKVHLPNMQSDGKQRTHGRRNPRLPNLLQTKTRYATNQEQDQPQGDWKVRKRKQWRRARRGPMDLNEENQTTPWWEANEKPGLRLRNTTEGTKTWDPQDQGNRHNEQEQWSRKKQHWTHGMASKVVCDIPKDRQSQTLPETQRPHNKTLKVTLNQYGKPTNGTHHDKN